MRLFLIGWSYRTTPVEVRDRLALTPEQQEQLAHQLRQKLQAREVMILSTCNRTEVVVAGMPAEASALMEELVRFWNVPELPQTAYTCTNLQAVEHLFRVASSLDSMVLGEPQILGQVKEAFHRFQEAGWTGRLLNPLFAKVFATAKRVRSETTIAGSAVSISYAAVELARQIFDDLSEQTVMIVGAGEMAELAVKHLIRNGCRRLLVANRTFANAARLAEDYRGAAIRFDQIGEYLADADIILTSTGAREPVITEPLVRQSLKKRKGRRMFFIDIAVPRDVAPEVNRLQDVYCFDIDDLQNVVTQNQQERQRQAEQAERIVEEEVLLVDRWFQSLSAVPVIRALRESYHEMGQQELEKLLKRMGPLSEKDQELLAQGMRSFINKLLHTPTLTLRERSQLEEFPVYVDTVRDLFELNDLESDGPKKAPEPLLRLIQKPA